MRMLCIIGARFRIKIMFAFTWGGFMAMLLGGWLISIGDMEFTGWAIETEVGMLDCCMEVGAEAVDMGVGA